jgi:Tol biopolymer transport system component
VGQPGNFYSPRFSHDGTLVAVDNSGVQNNGDIWIYGVNTSTAIRLTSDIADESRPIWSPEDDRVIFLSGKGGPDNIFAKHLNNLVVEDEIAADKDYLEPSDVSQDGNYLAYNKSERDKGAGGDIWVMNLVSGKSEPFVESRFRNEDARFSPDGKWMAYSSDETGQMEIFLQTFPKATQRKQVSVGGGFGPKWRGDGKELFYQSLDGMLMSVSFEHGPDAELAAPVPLFKVHSRFDETATDFDVSSDGQTFLINTAIEDDKVSPMSVVINFMNEWERR